MPEIVLSPNDLVRGCEESCFQCLAIVESLSAEQYASPIEGHSSIGAHLRHCTDHFLRFLEGAESGVIDYDARERDTEAERNPEVMRSTLRRILKGLRYLQPRHLDRAVTVIQTPAKNAGKASMPSTLARELVFLSSHSIHHLAIVELLARMADYPIPDEIGVAFSTQAYRERLAREQGTA